MLADDLGRRFKNLRVSLTAACNYACTYCVPDGKRLLPARHELGADQLLEAVSLLREACGLEKLRITGGEPLLSPKLSVFLRGVMAMPFDDVAMTTNGQLLERHSDWLIDTGLKRLNVSLDTLNPEGFRAIARGGDLKTVLRGMARMADAGMRIKVNMVPMRRSNRDQVVPLLRYCVERGYELRFIELMNMGHLKGDQGYRQDFLPMAELLSMIGEHYEFERADAPYDSTAVRFRIPAAHAHFGVIANSSAPFCQSCTRLRLASNGKLYGCLSSSRSRNMAPLLELPRAEALAALDAQLADALTDKQDLRFTGEVTVMKFIGG